MAKKLTKQTAKKNDVNVNSNSRRQNMSEESKEKKQRPVFNIADAMCLVAVLDANGKATGEQEMKSAVNDKGLLVACPATIKDGDEVLYAGWDPSFKALKKDAFADESAYIDYTALDAEFKSQKYAELAAERRKRASHIRQFGDSDTRKKAKKAIQLMEKLASIKEQLASEGISLADLGLEE